MISKAKVLPSGHMCTVWQNITVYGTRKNTYTMWIDQKSQHPVLYEMMGYDSLMGSHYDKYYLEYTSYVSGPLQPQLFNMSVCKYSPVKCVLVI